MEELFASLRKDFVEETGPLAREVAALVLRLEEAHADGEDDEELLRAMKSALHTIKGNAAMMGLGAIESLAHALEDFCLLVRQHPEVQDSGQAQSLVEGTDLLIGSIQGSLQGEPNPVPVAAFVERVAQAREAAGEAAAPRAASVRARPRASAAEEEPRSTGHKVEKPAPPMAGADEDGVGSTVRIGAREVDGLLDLTAEAIISHAELVRYAGRLARGHAQPSDAALLEQVLATLGRTTAEMRHDLLRVRLTPISTMFRRYARYVRDLARERGQAIQLVIEGGQVAVDRAIISRLHEPLVHMVRNAVAHGLESAEQRAAAGKPTRAQILLGARLAEGRARIVVADDGRGLDMAAIAAMARACGLCPERMPEGELRRLIFQPGFSTAAEVSTLAGRGVGLEVVANVVQNLGGRIDVRSVTGQGTVFFIDLPVTASLVKALVFAVDNEMFAVPASFVVDSMKVREESMHEINHVLVCPWRGDFLRTIDGGNLLGCVAQKGTRRYGIIIEAAAKRCALLVDWLVGVQEIVVRPLDETLRGSLVLAGLTILGQGRVVPILDCGEVLRRASGPGATVQPSSRFGTDPHRSTSHVI
jgi:two-component system, chemotaxis family, sensor kinase CheA